MNSELPLTRRDVVALVAYATLVYGVLSALLRFLSQLVLPRFTLFRGTGWDGDWQHYGVILIVSCVFAVAFWPIVSLIVTSGVGARSSRAMTKRDLFFVLSCAGVMLFVLSFSELAREGYDYSMAMMISTGGDATDRAYRFQAIASSGICAFTGFALAFLPSLFKALWASLRDEESAT